MAPDVNSRPASGITKQDIQNWLLDETDQTEEQEWSPATGNRYQAAFSLAYSVAIANEKLIFNPASLIKRKPENNERLRFLHKELNNDEEKRLVAVVADRIPFYRPMLSISIHTGMRRSEQIALKWP
jgi:integrase